jgi:hypothetical protein
LIEVIRCHHHPAAAVVNPALVAIVALSDRLCRSAYLGMGYVEARDPAACWQSEWKIVKANIPQAAALEWADFVKDADTYFAEIRELVVAMFHGKN